MLVGSDDGAVNHERFQILVCPKHLHDSKPSAAFAPTVKTGVRTVPVAQLWGQVPPG